MECREKLALERSKSNDKYCERLRAEILGKIERQTFVYTEYFPDSPRAAVFGLVHARKVKTIGDLLREYKPRAQRTLEHSTYNCYRKAIDFDLIPEFGALRADELTPAEIRRWVGTKKCSLKRIQNILLPLRNVLTEAANDGLIKANPLDRVKLSKLVAPEQRETDYEPNPYTEGEIVTLLANIPPRDRWAFQAWAYTGVRTGELVGLRWPRVDLEANTIAIEETTTERKDKPRPKTPAGRRKIELLPAAREAFEHARAYTQLTGDRVFVNERSTKVDHAWNDKRLAKVWRGAHKDTGIAFRNPYQLRHSFASNLLTQGENPSLIAKMLGHKNAEMVIRVYARWIERGAALGFDRPPRAYGMKRLWDATGVQRAG